MKRIIRGLTAMLAAIAALAGSATASSYTIDKVSTPSVLTGLWWNAQESGWGMTVTQQYGTIFVAMYTYDAANNPIWYVMTNCPVVANGCTGDIHKARGGSPLTSVWAPNLDVPKVGTGTLAFSDANTGTMNFTIDGISGSKAIIRQIFAKPPVSSGSVSNLPINYNGWLLNSLTLEFVGGKCMATLDITNPYTSPSGATLGFNILTGVRVGLLVLTYSTTLSGRYTVEVENARSCDGLTFAFDPDFSAWVKPPSIG